MHNATAHVIIVGMAYRIRPHVDLLLGGKLDERLATLRAEGLSHEQIARRISNESGMDLSRELIRRWFADDRAVSA